MNATDQIIFYNRNLFIIKEESTQEIKDYDLAPGDEAPPDEEPIDPEVAV